MLSASLFGTTVTLAMTTVFADTIHESTGLQRQNADSSYETLLNFLSKDDETKFIQIISGMELNREQQIALLQKKLIFSMM